MKSCPTCNRTYPDDTLAFCLVDGSVLSAPYDPEQTQRIPPPRTTGAAATEVLAANRTPLQSTIHAPAPQVPPLPAASISAATTESAKRSILPWLLVSGAILLVGIFGVWMVISRFSATSTTSSRNPSSPEPKSSVASNSKTMCGQTVSIALFEKWTEMGGETGKLGCPINLEADAPTSPHGSVGRWIQFAKGDGGYLIEFTRPQDAGGNSQIKPLPLAGHVFEVSGCMFKLYASLGGTKSWLGFPISDGQETEPGARQDFEGGYVLWDRKTYACEAHRN
jgi:hypothetical protein